MGLLDQASFGWKGLKEGKLWRRGIIPRMISAVLKKIECIEGQLEIFIDSHSARSKARSSPRVKGIVVDGVISRDNGIVQKAIKEFWGNLLGSVRPYNKDSLQKLIENHKPWFPKVDYHIVDGAKVDKLLRQCNNSSTGPDGIPFALYRVTSEQLCDMWCELIQRAGESMDFPKSFEES